MAMRYRQGRKSPFKPSFGSRPDEFIGRNAEIMHLAEAVDDINSRYRSTLVTGLKGFGKTSLISNFTDDAKDEDDIFVVSTSADSETQSILDDIAEQVASLLPKSTFELAELNIGVKPLGGMKFTKCIDEKGISYWRGLIDLFDRLNIKLDKEGEAENLLLITVDEVQASFKELRILATSFQMWVREHYNVMLVIAGLPQYVAWIEKDPAMSFLARSARIKLEDLNLKSVSEMYANVFSKNGKTIAGEIADKMAFLTGGYPFAVQLLGSLVWQKANSFVTLDIVEDAFDEAYQILIESSFQAIDIFDGNRQKVLLAIAKSQLQQFKPADLEKYLPDLSRTDVSRQLRSLKSFGLIEQHYARAPYQITFPLFINYLYGEYFD
jgi:AAA+ ATPase superfamily predicted ATPase